VAAKVVGLLQSIVCGGMEASNAIICLCLSEHTRSDLTPSDRRRVRWDLLYLVIALQIPLAVIAGTFLAHQYLTHQLSLHTSEPPSPLK
jgi:hypothetical protein